MHDDNDKIRLQVLGISYNQLQPGAYALILAQVDGPMRIPVVIGTPEAQAIAMRMERIIPQRPLTHDLFVSFAHAFGVKLKEVFIYKFEEGIFSSELTFTDGEREVTIDSRTSDAIAIAMRTHSPIFTTREIIDATGFVMEEADPDASDPDSSQESESEEEHEEEMSTEEKLDMLSTEDLQEILDEQIRSEQYENAAMVARIIDRRRAQNEADKSDLEDGKLPF